MSGGFCVCVSAHDRVRGTNIKLLRFVTRDTGLIDVMYVTKTKLNLINVGIICPYLPYTTLFPQVLTNLF